MKRVFKDVHVYFPPKVLADLKRLAKQNRRSVTAETVIAVERHVEQMREQQSERELTTKTIQHQTSLLRVSKQREAVTMSESIICPRCKTRVEIVEASDIYQIKPHEWAMRRRSEPCPASGLPVRGNWRNDPTYQRNAPPARELLMELDVGEK